jgi:TrfA protein
MATSKPIRTASEILAIGHTKANEARERMDNSAADKPVQMYLPGMDELTRAMPNHVARSSLFAPVGRGRKKQHVGTQLVSRSDATILYWGEQLDEAQADVYMQVMYEATKHTLGEPFVINVAAFLRAMGRSTGGRDYEWLFKAMTALGVATIRIDVDAAKNKGYKLGHHRLFHLIEWFDYDAETEAYMIKVDPRWQRVYGSKEFALVDWNKRLQITQGQDMAKALQRLIATSDEAVQRYALEWLKAKFEYGGRLRDFKTAISRALHELERLSIIKSGAIEASTRGKDQLVIHR